MAEGKKSFTAYCDWGDIFEALPDDKAGQLAKHLFRYVNDEKPETEDVLINATFIPIRNQLKRDLEKWRAQRDRNVANGSKGGRPKKPKEPTGLSGLSEKPTKTRNSNSNSNSKGNSNIITSITYREAQFKKLLTPFLEQYGKDMLNDFYLYWTEKKPKGRKMRFEMEKTFDVGRRLATWHKRQQNFEKRKTIPQQKEKSLAEKMREDYGITSTKQ